MEKECFPCSLWSDWQGIYRRTNISHYDWNNGTDLQHISLKAVFVFLAVALQKPGRKSKAKDHQVILSKRLEKWKRGEIEGLVREGRMIQTASESLKAQTHLTSQRYLPSS